MAFLYIIDAEANLKPRDGESREFYWLAKEDLENNPNIKSHIQSLKSIK